MQHLLDTNYQIDILNIAYSKHPGSALVDTSTTNKKKKMNIAFLYSKGLIDYTIDPVMTDFNPAPLELVITERGIAYLKAQIDETSLGQASRVVI